MTLLLMLSTMRSCTLLNSSKFMKGELGVAKQPLLKGEFKEGPWNINMAFPVDHLDYGIGLKSLSTRSCTLLNPMEGHLKTPLSL